jgi:1,4-alpha-glucan branching enzyme
MRLKSKINLLYCGAVAALFGCQPADVAPAKAPPAAVSQQTSQNPATTTANAEVQTTAEATTATATKKAWWQDAVVYQIWPRSFADSNKDGHGDFAGIQEKLSYLQDLGVDAIWLTPIFEAPSYHGYDFTEFYQVEQDYGSMAQFEALLADAKSRNIRIILDLVINHISDRHDWFVRSAKGEAPFKDYFIWRAD